MNRNISIFLLISTIYTLSINAQSRVTVEDMMEQVKSIYPVSFIYDSSIHTIFRQETKYGKP